MSTKAQIYYTEFFATLFVFIVALGFLVQAITNSTTDSDLQNLVLTGRLFSDNLVSAGYPANWTIANVKKIGLTDGTPRLDKNKLGKFYNMSYQSTKTISKTNYEYYFYVEKLDGTRVKVNGKDFAGKMNVKEKYIVKIERILFYNSSIVRAVIGLWK